MDITKMITEELHLQVYQNEPMSRHTSFQTGGNADLFIRASDKQPLQKCLELLKDQHIPVLTIGKGSNLLVGDRGIRGAVIQIAESMNRIEIKENMLTAQAGALLSSISNEAMEYGLAGFEFAAGIPGTFGGGIFMNAGAYGGEIKDRLVSVELLTETGEFQQLSADELELGYRTSNIGKRKAIVLEGVLALEVGDKNLIKEKMSDFNAQRRDKQPLEFPSAGSTFKRPEGHFAGKLIADAGLQGYQFGGAQVSEKHAGFVVNKGGATTKDIMHVINHCQKIVLEKFGVSLQTEVQIVGEQ